MSNDVIILRSAVNFIFKSRLSFGCKFDYSKVEYNDRETEVVITCPIHGEFKQKPVQHVRSFFGCPDCAQISRNEANCVIKDGKKKCSKCKGVFDVSEFDTFKRGGLYERVTSLCKPCRKEKDNKKVRCKDKEKQAAERYAPKRSAMYRQRILDKMIEDNASSDVYIQKCKVCGKVETLRKKPKTEFCKQHARKHPTLGRKLVHRDRESTCPKCGVVHVCKRKVGMCPKCSKEHRKITHKKHQHKRRAIIRGAKRGIAFSYDAIYKRDKWMCKLCGCKVQKKDIYADNAGEIDHIVPVSKGGLHIPSNVQVLCRACNQSKSDRTIGQLSVFNDSTLSW